MISNNRILFFDILRIIAIFAVVLIHSVYPSIEKIDQTRIYDWWPANIYDTISRWSISIMVMISGALLLSPQKDESIPTFFKKRFNKILIPTIFWSIFYTYTNGIDMQMSTILQSLITGRVSSIHLWFLYLIIGLYISTPILRIFIKNANNVHIEYFIFIWIVSIINTYMKTRHNIGIGIEMGFFTGFIGYYILGYYLVNTDFDKKYKNLIYILAFLGALITMFGTYVLTTEKNSLDDFYYGYLSPNVMVMSIGIFIFFKNIDWKNSKIFNNLTINNVIVKMSTLSFGVYLIHITILSLVKDLNLTSLFGYIIGIPLLATITMLISYFLVKIIYNIPVLKHVV